MVNAKMVAEAKKAADPVALTQMIQKETQTANFKKMGQIRRRVDATVKDHKTAEALKPWYNYMCKRSAFHNAYLPTFNRQNVTLVDTEGRGVERITEKGIVFISTCGVEMGSSSTNIGTMGRSITQSALAPNFQHLLNEQAEHIAFFTAETLRRGATTVETSQESEDEWIRTIIRLGRIREGFLRECTPSYYDDEGT
ncbi:FAD/NAD(P)-binding domain superfamily [Fusarium oxysporum f. sp. vasinfectum]|nr:FAD/NAD(P)-binding domain superfamily [Fusarium oxysporum f. sp. vasinfectum]